MLEAQGLISDVVEDIVSSYETKLQSVGSILDIVHQILEGSKDSFLYTAQEREKINSELREILAKNGSLRKKDFDNMMRGVLSSQGQKEEEVRSLLKDYINEQRNVFQELKEKLGKLRDSLARGEVEKVREYKELIEGILNRQEKKKEEITSKLKDFQKEQRDLTAGIKELLAKGKDLRIKDFKLMLKKIKDQRQERLAYQKKRKEEVAKMLHDFRQQRQKFAFAPKAINIDAQDKEKV